MKVLVVDDEPTVRKLIQRYLGDHGYEVVVAENGAAGWAVAREGGADLILSDVAMPEMDGYELVRTVRRNPQTASIPVILLSAHRAQPTGEPAAPALGRLVCVTSAKGGVGVSTVAANLAVLLARSSQAVCAVDLDLAHGDLQVLLDLRPRTSLADAARDLDPEQGTLSWEEYLVHHATGPWLLAAPHSPHEAAAVTEAAASQVIQALRGAHEKVVADVPPSYGELALSVYEAAERVVVVTSPEITALRRTRELLAVLERIGVPEERVVLVLNTLFEKPSIDRERAETFLRRRIGVVIPFGGRAFLEAVSGGRPVVSTQKGRPVDALGELAALV